MKTDMAKSLFQQYNLSHNYSWFYITNWQLRWTFLKKHNFCMLTPTPGTPVVCFVWFGKAGQLRM